MRWVGSEPQAGNRQGHPAGQQPVSSRLHAQRYRPSAAASWPAPPPARAACMQAEVCGRTGRRANPCLTGRTISHPGLNTQGASTNSTWESLCGPGRRGPGQGRAGSGSTRGKQHVACCQHFSGCGGSRYAGLAGNGGGGGVGWGAGDEPAGRPCNGRERVQNSLVRMQLAAGQASMAREWRVGSTALGQRRLPLPGGREQRALGWLAGPGPRCLGRCRRRECSPAGPQPTQASQPTGAPSTWVCRLLRQPLGSARGHGRGRAPAGGLAAEVAGASGEAHLGIVQEEDVHQESHKAPVGVGRGEAAQVKDAQNRLDGGAVAAAVGCLQSVEGPVHEVHAQPLAVLQVGRACGGAPKGHVRKASATLSWKRSSSRALQKELLHFQLPWLSRAGQASRSRVSSSAGPGAHAPRHLLCQYRRGRIHPGNRVKAAKAAPPRLPACLPASPARSQAWASRPMWTGSPVRCLAARTTITGRPLTSVWVCRYALPVAASRAMSVHSIKSALQSRQRVQAGDAGGEAACCQAGR